MPKAKTGHINLPFWENLIPRSVKDDKTSSCYVAHRLKEVALSKTKHFIGQVGAELERWRSSLCLSIIQGSALEQETVEQKTMQEQKLMD